jgi:pimeloyl-ACP methyl ester carboxylesterase
LLQRAGFVRRWEQTSEGRIHILDGKGQGDLPPVILLAGLGSRGTHFRRCIRYLLPRVQRVILPDLPGHGHSETPADGLTGPSLERGIIESLHQLLDGTPAVFLGNSLGGFMACRHAIRHPEDVLGLLLVSPGGAWMKKDEIRPYYDRFRLRSHADALRLIDAVFARSYTGLRHVLAWGARRQLGVGPPRNLIDTVEQRFLLRQEELCVMPMPVRLVWGTADGVAPEDQLDYFRKSLPKGTQVERPSNFGHSPYLEQPKDFADRLLAFIEQEVLPAKNPVTA